MYVLRNCKYYKQKKYNILQYIFFRTLLHKYKYKFGYEIPLNLKIGRGIYINHLGGIAINPETVIGNNINLTKGITIGQINNGLKKGAPTIENSVWIGANATIVGKIRIGNNVLIAPNSYINFDVPDNSIVIGNPGQIISKENATEGYINHLV
jgi:serine O-acetyltransferase